jgi:hypothetical protein
MGCQAKREIDMGRDEKERERNRTERKIRRKDRKKRGARKTKEIRIGGRKIDKHKTVKKIKERKIMGCQTKRENRERYMGGGCKEDMVTIERAKNEEKKKRGKGCEKKRERECGT